MFLTALGEEKARIGHNILQYELIILLFALT